VTGERPAAPAWLAKVHLPGGRGTLALGPDGRWRADGAAGSGGGPGVVLALWADQDCHGLADAPADDALARRLAAIIEAAWPGAVAEFPAGGPSGF
jgi:hypothetical protein